MKPIIKSKMQFIYITKADTMCILLRLKKDPPDNIHIYRGHCSQVINPLNI
jgi:hypothetical protein